MPLENLLTLIEKLRERIDSHGDALKKNEMLTRYALIDPLLRELGWDTEDPDVVVPEYRSDGGRPDYALHKEGKPIIMLEAKSLDTPLKDAVKQVINYCIQEGTDYFAVTDGRRWEIYETHKRGSIDEKRIISLDLKITSAADVCLNTLALWRPSVISGQVVVGETPVIGLSDDQQSTTEPRAAGETTVQPPLPVQSEEGWESLSEINPESKDPPPTEILFPDNSGISIESWRALLIEVTRWLIKEDILKLDHCPIWFSDRPSATNYIVATSARHSHGTEVHAFEKIGPFYIELTHNAGNCVTGAERIIKHVGQDSTQFKVRLP